MNTNQKLRFMINKYWELIWEVDLYSKYKKILKIKNAKEMSDSNKHKVIEQFKVWIKDMEQNPESIEEVKNWLKKELED
jgi:ABC-type lipoprotein release transport system permease subunit